MGIHQRATDVLKLIELGGIETSVNADGKYGLK